MIFLLITAAIGFAGGVWLIAGILFPSPPPLTSALARLHDDRPSRTVTPSTVPSNSFLVRLGRRLADRSSLDLISGNQTLADLEVVRRPLEVHAGATAACAIAGALLGPLLWMMLTLAGTPAPVVISIGLMPIGGLTGLTLPKVLLQVQADSARIDFRHALGAYLDILVVMLAAGEGAESAMGEAAKAGNGPAFMELRRATARATYSGAVWNALDDLGERIGIVEIREIAAAGTLAGEEGAAVRSSLVAKARSLRNSTLTAAEVAARQRSQAMFAPIVMIGFAFITFLIYPLLTNLSI